MAHDYCANPLAPRQRGEAFVNLIQPDTLCDEFVQLETSFQILAGETGEVALRTCPSITRAHDPLFTHQRSPAKTDVFVHIDFSKPHDLSPRTHRLDEQRQGQLRAD